MVVEVTKCIPGGLPEAALRLRGNAMCSGTIETVAVSSLSPQSVRCRRDDRSSALTALSGSPARRNGVGGNRAGPARYQRCRRSVPLPAKSTAATLRAHQPLAAIEHRRVSAILRCEPGSLNSNWCRPARHQTISRQQAVETAIG